MRCLKAGLLLHVQSIKAGFEIPIIACNKLIHLFSRNGLVRESQKLFDEMPERNVFSWNAIICAHVRTHSLAQAKRFFDSASVRDLVTYNSMLSGYSSVDGYEMNALPLFVEMQRQRFEIGVDEVSITTMVNLFAKLGMLGHGRQLHGYMVKTGNDRSGFSVSSLIDMYSKCGRFEDACWVFEGCEAGNFDLVSKNAMVGACCREGDMEMASRMFWREKELIDLVSWNTLLSGYVQNGFEEEALKLFVCMERNGVKWNEYSFASLLSACSGLKNMKLGKEVHGWVLKNGLISNRFVESGVADVYCKCGNMKYAVSMHLAGGTENPFLVSSMIVGYSLLGNMTEARRLFDSLAEKRNAVLCTALVSGYVKSRQCDAAFELLREFQAKGAVVHDSLILVHVLGACSLQAALSPGKQIHGYALRMGIKMDEKMMSSLVDMYSKCGSLLYAERIFQKVTERDSVLYNVMIAGYAHHGHDIQAIQLFQKMVERGIRPDAITFIALLSVCRHCGLVELGEKFFHSMTKYYGIRPEMDHYACMIDLYGRAKQLEKVVELMKMIPVEKQDATILGAFLNACRLNRNAELAKEAEEKLLNLAGEDGGRYVQLANVYAAGGNWTEMRRIRKQMRETEVKKLAGCSWVYMDDGVHIFTSGDKTHSKAELIYSILACLTADLYGIGGVFN